MNINRADFSFELRIIKVFQITRSVCMIFPPWDLSLN
jgi:hypothetical protein